MRVDPVGMIEACYAPVVSDEEWLKLLLESMESVEMGMGLGAGIFQIREHRFGNRVMAVHRFSAEALAQNLRFFERDADPALVDALFTPAPAVTVMSQLMRGLPRESVSGLPESLQRAGGVRDAFGVTALLPDGSGIRIIACSRQMVQLPPRVKNQLVRVSAHLMSAYRLRSRVLRALDTEDEGVEAMLNPSGRLEHAAGPAKERRARLNLVEAVRKVERARGRLRRTDPDEAMALWTGLVDGRWSLVDHCERDGRRFVLARRNDPGVRDPKALTQRERDVLAHSLMGHSNKFIGYLLGLAPSTVSSYLESGMKKLKVSSRRALMAEFAARRKFVPNRG